MAERIAILTDVAQVAEEPGTRACRGSVGLNTHYRNPEDAHEKRQRARRIGEFRANARVRAMLYRSVRPSGRGVITRRSHSRPSRPSCRGGFALPATDPPQDVSLVADQCHGPH